jgi:hypothetical protein
MSRLNPYYASAQSRMFAAAGNAAGGADVSDRGRRELAESLVCSMAFWPRNVPEWARMLMAGVLMLPADHPAAVPPASVTLVDKICPESQVMVAALPASATVVNKICRESPVELGVVHMVPIPSAVTAFPGPYAYPTPEDLRRATMPGARMRAEHRLRQSTPADGYRIGFFLMSWTIQTVKGAPTAAMAPWAVALAQSVGGLAALETDGTPFCLVNSAVLYANEMADALLDVSGHFAVDVNNCRGEPATQLGHLALDVNNCRGEPARHSAPAAGMANGATLLHHLIDAYYTDLPLFRKLLARCSDASLNDCRSDYGSPLHSAVRNVCLSMPSLSPRFAASVEIVLAILERAEPDGSGVRLDMREPCEWVADHPQTTTYELSAYEALMRYDLSDYGPYYYAVQVRSIIAAFDAARERQRAYRASLGRALASALLHVDPPSVGLPVPRLLGLVSEYVLVPPPTAHAAISGLSAI